MRWLEDRLQDIISKVDYKKPGENDQCQLCGRWNNRPIEVDVVIVRNNKVLLIKRATDPDKGKYAVPGGYLDRGESVEEAVIREAKEETGLDIEILKTVGIRSNPDRYRQIVAITFIAKATGGTELPGDGVESILWADPDELPPDMATIGEHDQVVQSALPVLRDLNLQNV